MPTSKLYSLSQEVALHVTYSGHPTAQTPTLIFLHFWGGSSQTFTPLTTLLPPFHCIAISFRGWGLSTGPARASAYRTEDLASDIETLLPLLHIPEFVLVGHSMGAKVAQLIAGRGLLAGLRGLVLLAPAPPTPLELPADMRAQQVSAYDSAASAEFVVRHVLAAAELGDGVVRGLVADMLRGNSFARAAWPAYGVAESVVDEARMVRVPVLVLVGERDRVEPLERVEREVLGNIKGAEIVVLKEKGHLLPVEAPTEVAAHISTFIEKISMRIEN